MTRAIPAPKTPDLQIQKNSPSIQHPRKTPTSSLKPQASSLKPQAIKKFS
jgi:hypothetical protein